MNKCSKYKRLTTLSRLIPMAPPHLKQETLHKYIPHPFFYLIRKQDKTQATAEIQAEVTYLNFSYSNLHLYELPNYKLQTFCCALNRTALYTNSIVLLIKTFQLSKHLLSQRVWVSDFLLYLKKT